MIFFKQKSQAEIYGFKNIFIEIKQINNLLNQQNLRTILFKFNA